MDMTMLEKELRANASGIDRFVLGAIVLNQDKDSALVLKRDDSDFMPNLEELPSGKLAQDESFEDGLKRELTEETGLNVTNIVGYIGYFDYRSNSGRLTRQFNFIVEADKEEPIVLQDGAHSGFRWCKLDDPSGLGEVMIDLFEKAKKFSPIKYVHG